MFQLSPLGTQQSNTTKPSALTLTTVGTTETIIYLCPAGKSARIESLTDMNVALGANTLQNLRLIINAVSVNLRKMVGVEVVPISENVNGMKLNAGDKISAFGDNAGNNGTINVFATVTELPA